MRTHASLSPHTSIATWSNDLGAIAGLLFDIGSGRYQAPPREDDESARAAWEADLARVEPRSAGVTCGLLVR